MLVKKGGWMFTQKRNLRTYQECIAKIKRGKTYSCQNSKQVRSWLVCFFRSSLIWVCTVCPGLFGRHLVFKILERLLCIQERNPMLVKNAIECLHRKEIFKHINWHISGVHCQNESLKIANREDPDQTASSEAVWSGSALFVYAFLAGS